VNQRVGVDEFESASDGKNWRHIGGENPGGFEAQDRPNTFSARFARCNAWRDEWREAARPRRASGVPRRRLQRLGLLRKMQGDSSSGGWRPVALSGGIRLGLFLGFWIERLRCQLSAGLLEQNYHFAFACSRCFWQSRESWTPSSNSFHGFIQREVRTLQLSDNFFQARQRMPRNRASSRARFFSPALDSRLSFLFTRWQRVAKIGCWIKGAF